MSLHSNYVHVLYIWMSFFFFGQIKLMCTISLKQLVHSQTLTHKKRPCSEMYISLYFHWQLSHLLRTCVTLYRIEFWLYDVV